MTLQRMSRQVNTLLGKLDCISGTGNVIQLFRFISAVFDTVHL